MTQSYGLTLEDLEEALSEILPPGFEIRVIKEKVVIHTNLVENSYGELVPVDSESEEDDSEDEDELEDFLDEEELENLED